VKIWHYEKGQENQKDNGATAFGLTGKREKRDCVFSLFSKLFELNAEKIWHCVAFAACY